MIMDVKTNCYKPRECKRSSVLPPNVPYFVFTSKVTSNTIYEHRKKKVAEKQNTW